MDILTTFKDNCGFGLIANVKDQPSRQMTLDAIEALSRMIHRGAIAADKKSGDGSGFLFSMPHKFMHRIASFNGFDLPEKFAVAMIFSTRDEHLEVFKEKCDQNDLKVLFFRNVPVHDEHLGKQALDCKPNIVQAFVVPNSPIATKRFKALLYLTRKEIGHHLSNDPDFYIASFSDKTISYKGLVMPTYLKAFYLDLQEEDFEVSFALFHQRFSTNTLPRWSLAQPFRTLAHNGEINAIKANRFNVVTLSEVFESQVYTQDELSRLMPILTEHGSDSASVDHFFEFLIHNGVDFFKAARSMVPAPWQNSPHMDAKLRSFYEYAASNMEAWDGPAALNFTDGRFIGCILDRNGLRPAKYIITHDNRIIISSEYGVLDIEKHNIAEQGKLKSGQMIGVDLRYGAILKDQEINDYIKNSRPYTKWINDNQAYLMEHVDRNFENFEDYRYDNLTALQRFHNFTYETVENIVRPMIKNAKEETGSMGDDTPLACFSQVQRNFTDFFRQKFAQVTNPPIDPLREKVVMSTKVSIGAKNNILKEQEANTHRVRTNSPVLSKENLDVLKAFGTKGSALFDEQYLCETFQTGYTHDLRESLKALAELVEDRVYKRNIRVVFLDDRVLSPDQKPMPMAMVVGYLNQYLQKKKMRSKVTLVAITGEVYDSHSFAVLLAYGATAVYPYLLYASVLQILERDKNRTLKEKKQAFKNLAKALNAGLLKILSKMGISTIESYINSGLFDVIGLNEEIVQDCFKNSYYLLSGLSYEDIEERIEKYHKNAHKHLLIKKSYALEVGSFYKYMDKGEYHDFSPDVIHSIHKFASSGSGQDYEVIRDRINSRGQKMIRDFFDLHSERAPIDIKKVEPAEDIFRRFSSAAMSLGSISPEAHEAMAEAMNRIGGMSNSGEGGEDAKRFGSIHNSKIKQVASGRFGVTPAYLRSALEMQIKVAQGAKPGEGGQLPGSKVSPLIASLRCTNPGITLISPPPHHDIYSIEDLAQLIFDLKQVNPEANVSVKLVSTVGVGTIAVGVAKAYADKIIISGSEGGTGAAQLNSIKFAGNPWETGLSEAHNALKANNLRSSVELQTDGGLKTGLDVVKAAILGAESYAFGTVLLSTVGCKILRVCHLNKCSVGIATQDETLREYYTGTVNGIVNYLTNVAEEVREILASLGYEKLDDIIGQTHLLKAIDCALAKKFDFSSVLINVEGDNLHNQKKNEPFDKNLFEKEVLQELKPAIEGSFPVTIEKEIKNTNRSFGAYISGYIASRYGDAGLPKKTLNINLKGYAGQSLGAFLSNGMSITLTGTANDYVGKGMHGGQLIIVPDEHDRDYSLAGNTCLYGATGGKLFVAGRVGERFGVRNSGALAVVEGTGDHPCEYMTGGTAVILGPTGSNFGAGMTGGVAFVYDREMAFTDKLNQELIKKERIDTDEADEARYYLKSILKSHYNKTGSPIAKRIMAYFSEEIRFFWMVTSKDMKSPLNPIEGN